MENQGEMMKVKLFMVILISLFCFSCSMTAQYTDGTIIHTITSERNSVVTYDDGKVKMVADFRGNRSAWEFVFPAAFNKSNDVTYETGGE